MDNAATFLLGYAARRPSPEYLTGFPPQVLRFSNASICGMDEPSGIDQHGCWYTNHGLMDRESLLFDGDYHAQAGFLILQFRVHPIWFDEDGRHLELHPSLKECVAAEELAHPYKFSGFDLLQVEFIEGQYIFGCSPLRCNLYWREIEVNADCLISDKNNAIEAGVKFGNEQPEPGDYLLIEVYRRTQPGSPLSRG